MSEWKKLESRWQSEWAKAKLFEAEPDKRKKYYIVFAYPTVSGTLHAGQMRSYSIPDVIARYKRARGFNVFFPLGFHATGIDCQRIFEKSKDAEAMARYGIPASDAKKFKSAVDVAEYLQKRMIASFKQLGLSLDYRPAVSTIHPQYGKFIRWQFRKLRELGLLTQKDYRLAWCPIENHPVSLDPAEADIQEWKGAQIKDYVIIKFKCGDLVLPAATMRPETIFGVTNVWLNPNATYVRSKVGNETWLVAEPAVKKLQDLDKKVQVLEKFDVRKIIGESARNPATGKDVPILAGDFADPSEATGIVMSVPAHDPYDFIYLKTVAPELKPIQVVEVPGYGAAPAGEIIAKNKITDPKDSRLESVVKELYKLEYNGRMHANAKQFKGMAVPKAKIAITQWLTKLGSADMIYELSIKPVHCRCGAEIIIKKVPGQWFIDYSNEEWKEKAKKHVPKMNIWPNEYKKELPSIIDWLEARPCVRRRGLGTEFPFEPGWIIEAISDSTIYMAFYIVSKYFNEGKLKMDDLTDEFFDYVFLGKGKASNKLWKDIRNEFLYWYPLDINAIGKEHKSVHLPFFIMNHVAIFPEKHWPSGIFVNWHLVAYGKKMSKHLGNVIFWHDAIEKYGADAIRLYLTHGSNQWHDFDWRNEECEGYGRQLMNFYNMVQRLTKIKTKATAVRPIDRWLRSRLNRHIKDVTTALDIAEIRKAVDIAFFNILSDVGWYLKRTDNPRTDWLGDWLRLLAPFIPHVAEDLWHAIGNKDFIINAGWPAYDGKAINPTIEAAENLVRKVQGDIDEIKKISGISKPAKISLIVSAPWKYDVYNMVMGGKPLHEIMEDKTLKPLGKAVVTYVQKLEKRKPLDELFLGAGSELAALRDAKDFFEKVFSCPVEIWEAEKAANISELANKASAAEPCKPGILLV
ncbi:MAG: leucine--tRNA ligase [Candidatus Aenigmatarchaeota archaeon]